MLDEKVRNKEVLYPSARVLEACEVYINSGSDYIERLDRAWTELKAN